MVFWKSNKFKGIVTGLDNYRLLVSKSFHKFWSIREDFKLFLEKASYIAVLI